MNTDDLLPLLCTGMAATLAVSSFARVLPSWVGFHIGRCWAARIARWPSQAAHTVRGWISLAMRRRGRRRSTPATTRIPLVVRHRPPLPEQARLSLVPASVGDPALQRAVALLLILARRRQERVTIANGEVA